MQRDGNLVVYREDGQAMWASGTSGDNNAVVIQGDGNLVIYENRLTNLDEYGLSPWTSNVKSWPIHKQIFTDTT